MTAILTSLREPSLATRTVRVPVRPNSSEQLVFEFELPANTEPKTLEQFGQQIAGKLDELERQLGGNGLRLTKVSLIQPDDVAVPPPERVETWRLNLRVSEPRPPEFVDDAELTDVRGRP